MTILICGAVFFAIFAAWHLGRESGRIDHALELWRTRDAVAALEDEVAELRLLLAHEKEWR